MTGIPSEYSENELKILCRLKKKLQFKSAVLEILSRQ